MCFFENDYFLNILKTYKPYTFPLLVPIISQMADKHWHKVLQESLNALKTILREIDYSAFEKALANKDNKMLMLVNQDQKEYKKERQKQEQKWDSLLKIAMQKNPNLKDINIPYNENHIVGEHNGIFNGNVNIM